MISVIIPTYNEAKYLPDLLESLKSQTCNGFEIIVADSGSSDGTIELAKQAGAIVLEGEKKGVAEGRNRGAKAAKNEILLFVDADCVLPSNLIQSVLEASQNPNVIGGSTGFWPLDGKFLDKIMFRFANDYQRLTTFLGYPHNAGYCFFFKKQVFEWLGGIKEDMLLNETHDIALRSWPFGKFVFLPVRVLTSMRRFHNNGYSKTIFKEYLPSTLVYYLTGKTPKKIFHPEPVR
jgi:glycosyltransferase involved in cell wall biosynthesis